MGKIRGQSSYKPTEFPRRNPPIYRGRRDERIIIFDFFNDADNTKIDDHTAAPINLPGNAWVSSQPTETIRIQSNRATLDPLTAPLTVVNTRIDAEEADVKINAYVNNVDSTNNIGRVMYRYRDDNSNYGASYTNSFTGDKLVIFEIVAGSGVLRASKDIAPPSQPYQITVTTNGNNHTARIGGDTVSYTSASLATETIHGFSLNTSNELGGSWVDSFKVVDNS